MKQHPSALSACKFLKSILCLALISALLLCLGACGNQDSGITKENGKFIDAEGNQIEDSVVNLDFLSRFTFKKDFDKLKKIDDRQRIIREYLMYHLPTSVERDSLVLAFLEHPLTDTNIPSQFEDQLSQTDDFLSEASSVLSLASFCAEIQGDSTFGDFIDKIDKTELGENALQIVKAGAIIADLSNNKIENKQEYCDDLIYAFQYLTSFIPVWGDYFDEGLGVVKEGIDIVIEQVDISNRKNVIYGEDPKKSAFFSIVLDKDKDTQRVFEFILDPSKWETSPGQCPTIADIFSRKNQFVNLSKEGITCLREYLFFRIPYEMEHPEYQGAIPETEPTVNNCQHNHRYTTILEPTCETEGKQRDYCSLNCGYDEIRIIKATGHDYEQTVIAPTYESQGYTLHTCKACGASFEDSYVDALPIPLPDLARNAAWFGYLVDPPFTPERFDITIDQMTQDHISGSLEVSALYEVRHQTAFEGTGTAADGKLVYALLFETPAVLGTIPTFTYDTITMYYDPATDCFTFEGCYDVDMYSVPLEAPPTLAENVTWSGFGEDPYYNALRQEGHEFVLDVSKMNDQQISGYFTLTYDGNVDHASEFVGRGFRDGNMIYYEVKLFTPRTEKNIIEITVETFRLRYYFETDTFEIDGFYSAEIARRQE